MILFFKINKKNKKYINFYSALILVLVNLLVLHILLSAHGQPLPQQLTQLPTHPPQLILVQQTHQLLIHQAQQIRLQQIPQQVLILQVLQLHANAQF